MIKEMELEKKELSREKEESRNLVNEIMKNCK